MASCKNDFLCILLLENQFDNQEQDSLVQKVLALVTIFLLLTHKNTKRGSAPRSVTWRHLRFFFFLPVSIEALSFQYHQGREAVKQVSVQPWEVQYQTALLSKQSAQEGTSEKKNFEINPFIPGSC